MMKNGKRFWIEKADNWFIGLVVAFITLMFVMEHINGRFWLNDFKVMYSAADAYVHGKPVYGLSFGLETGFYKYSPFTLLFFVPYTWLPYELAASIHFLIIGLIFVLLVRSLNRFWEIPEKDSKKGWIFLTVFIAVVVHLTRELHLGNVNILLVFLIVRALICWKNEKFWSGSLLMAIVLLTKPYLLILALPFMVRLRWRELAYTVLVIGVYVGLSFVLTGWSSAMVLHEQWIHAMLDHSGYLTSDNTLFSILQKSTGMVVANNVTLALFGLTAVGLVVLIFRSSRKNQREATDLFIPFSVMVLFALTPNFLITDTEHFLFSVPLIWWILTRFSYYNLPEKMWMVLGVFLYAFNPVKEFGTLGIGNLLLIVLAIHSYIKYVSVKH